jgi:hypothetical protein
MNSPSLEAAIKAEAPKSLEQGPAKAKTITTKTFKLHEDQKQVVHNALKKASDETGSTVEAVNLEAICQNYLGSGLMFADDEHAVTYAANHADDPVVFVETRVTRLKELFPQLNIAVEITFKESIAAA